jgi:uncharacterized repeat protein (TIGR03803 family)
MERRTGGEYGIGTIYKVNTSGTAECVLHSFAKIPDGIRPIAPLRQWSIGSGSMPMFFGTTVEGGTQGLGTVFEISPNYPSRNCRSAKAYRAR